MSPGRKKPQKKKTVKKATSKQAAVKKTAATRAKSTARKTAAKKTTARKAAAKKTAAAKKKPVAKKVAARKKPVARAPAKTPAQAPARPARARPSKPAKLDAETLKSIREQLSQELANLRLRQAELEQDSFGDTQSDMTGEVGLDEDFADAGTATFERERDLSLHNNIRDLIDQIERALDRIEHGTYGRCEACGRPIEAARLRALPHASLCMECKRREERAR